MDCCERDNEERQSLQEMGGWDVSENGGSGSSSNDMTTFCNPGTMLEAADTSDQDVTADESNSYIANALQNMSLEQRNILYHELHGVVDVVDESPDFLRECFLELRKELDLQTKKSLRGMGGLNCWPLILAQSQDHKYVHSTFMYKAFLRAERFDVKKAALRFIRFYEFKQMSFGDAKLCKDVTQDLLSVEDLRIYRKGLSQVLPCRDVMGRCILVMFPSLSREYGTPDRQGRLYLYHTFRLIQDEETQRKGATVVVMAGCGSTPSDGDGAESGESAPMMDLKFVPTAARGLMALPIRYAVVHNCFDDSRWKFIMKLGLKIVSPDMRARNKVHFGAPMECLYELMGFGIPPDVLPVDMRGVIKNKQHVDFIKMCKQQEEWVEQGRLEALSQITVSADSGEEVYEAFKYSFSSLIVIPANADVLLGRGKPIHSHPGNVRLHGLVDELIPYYETCRKLEKTKISIELVGKIRYDIGGRFLKQDSPSGVWLVTDDDTARSKVSHLFRARRDGVLDALKSKEAEDKTGALLASRRQSEHEEDLPAVKRARYDNG